MSGSMRKPGIRGWKLGLQPGESGDKEVGALSPGAGAETPILAKPVFTGLKPGASTLIHNYGEFEGTGSRRIRQTLCAQGPDSAAKGVGLRCEHANRTSEQMATSAGARCPAGRPLCLCRAHHGSVLPAVMSESAAAPRFGGILRWSARGRARRLPSVFALQADPGF